MNKENTKHSDSRKRLVRSMLVLLLCIAMLIGSTWAWFTDSASNTNNRIVAGNLKIDLLMDKTLNTSVKEDYVSINGGQGDIFEEANIAKDSNLTLWEPGKTQVVYLAVENQGDLAVKYNTYIDVTDNGLVGSLEYALFDEGTYAKYKQLVASGANTWSLLKAQATVSGDVLAGRTVIKTGVLDEIANGTKNERDYVALAVHMKESAGNEYQGKDAIIDVTIVATQKDAESDTFSNTYDSGAKGEVPAIPVHAGASTDAISATSSGTTASFTASGAVKSASMPMEIAKDMVPEIGDTVNEHTVAEGEDVNSVFSLTVDTTEQTDTSATYEINLWQTTVVSKDGTVLATEEKQIAQSSQSQSLDDWLTGVIQLTAKLENVKVTHSGAEMTAMTSEDQTTGIGNNGGYYYDSVSGELTIKSKSFSPYKVTYDSDYVASIQGQGYRSLEDAVGAAQEGDTITLTKDIDLTGYARDSHHELKFADNVTLDLNGNTITSNNYGVVYEGTGLTIQNGNFVAAPKPGTSETNADSYALFVGLEGATTSTTLEGLTCTGGINVLGSATVTIDNTEVTGTKYYAVYANENTNVTINGGTYTTEGSLTGTTKYAVLSDSKGTLQVTGGTYSTDPSAYVAAGKAARKTNDVWEVVDAVVNAAYGSTTKGYASLADAVKGFEATSETSATFTLLSDITAGDGVDFGFTDGVSGRIYSVDFNNHTYTFQGKAVGSTGTVTNGFRVEKTATVNLSNGSLTNGNTVNDDFTNTPAKTMINSYGTLNLTNLSIDATSDAVQASGTGRYGTAALYISNGTTNIYGNSNITAATNVQDDKSCYAIMMANVSGYTDKAVLNFGGNIDYTGKVTGKVKDGQYQDSQLNIANGTFDFPAIDKTSRMTVAISGGKFYQEPNADYLKTNYISVKSQEETVDVWTVRKLFDGKGTADDPYRIDSKDKLQAISNECEYKYYKIEQMTAMDCSDWTPVYLCGSFDGNGIVINNLDSPLFQGVWNGSESWAPGNDTANTYTIENLTVNANINAEGWIAGVVRTVGVDKFVMDNVVVHGNIAGASGAASFICFGPGNYAPQSVGWQYDGHITFKNCKSDATIQTTSGNSVGFIAHAMMKSSAGTITLENSEFTGTLIGTSASNLKYICGNWINATITDDAKSTKDNVVYKSSNNGWTYIAEGKTAIGVTVEQQNKPSNIGDTFSVSAKNNAVKAVFSLQISPNPYCMTSTYLTETISSKTNNSFASSQMKYFTVRVNPEGATSTGVDGNFFNVVNGDFNGTLGSNTIVRVTQYDSGNHIVGITEINFHDVK